MAQTISLYPLGVGDSGTQAHWHTSFLLQVDERRLMVDCPRSLQEMLAYNQQHGERAVTLADCRQTILTHLHFDHAEGIVELANSGALADGSVDGPSMTLYAPAGMLAYLWSDSVERGVMSAAQVVGGTRTLDRYFRPVALANPHDFGAFALHYRATQHIANTFAYRFDFGDFTLGYSADTAYDPALIAWLDECDVVIHEVLLPPWSDVEFVRRLHTPWTDLLQLPAEFQARTLLCHYGDNYAEYQDLGRYRYLRQNKLYRLK